MHRPLPALLVIAALAVGCGEPPRAPVGTAVIATSADADVLVPPLSRTNIGAAVGDQLFLRLAEMGLELNTVGDEGFIPELAESWEWEDSVTIVFRLHPRANWHDGRPVSGDDVAFTFALARDSVAALSAGPLLGAIDSVKSRGRKTVAFHFARAYAEQFYDATHHLWILPKHAMDTIPPERLREHPLMRNPLGAGPYRLVRWQPGELIELAADTNFFRGPAGIARLIWRVTPDFNAAITQVSAGEADILEAVLGPENVARISEAPHMRLVEYASPVYMYVGFNMTRPGRAAQPHPLFGDRDLRRALAVGINRQVLIDAVLEGRGDVPRGPITPMVSLWPDAPRQLPFDSARARAELDRLGWRDTDGDGVRERNGRRLAFDLLVPSSSAIRVRTAVLLQEQYRQLGVDMRLVELEFNTFNARGTAGRFDALLGALGINPPPSAMRELWSSEGIGGLNYGRYASTAFDSLTAVATRTRDASQARSVWLEAIRAINEDAPAIWLFTPSLAAAVHERFENVSIRPDAWAAFLWDWTVAPESAAESE